MVVLKEEHVVVVVVVVMRISLCMSLALVS